MFWRNQHYKNVEPSTDAYCKQESQKIQGQHQSPVKNKALMGATPKQLIAAPKLDTSTTYIQQPIGAFRLAGYFTWNEEAAGSNPVSYTKWFWWDSISQQSTTMLSSAMVSTSDFDSDNDISNLSLTTNVGFSLSR